MVYLKEVKYFILNLSYFSGRQNYLIYSNTVIFFTSGGGVTEVLMKLLLVDPRMPIRCAFHPAVQYQKSRDIHFGQKGVRISQKLFPIYIHTLLTYSW